MRITHIALFVTALVTGTSALHFYLDSNEERCFIEELPTDTIVEGGHFSCARRPPRQFITSRILLGHYRALEWDDQQQKYAVNDQLGIQVDVDVSAQRKLACCSSSCY